MEKHLPFLILLKDLSHEYVSTVYWQAGFISGREKTAVEACSTSSFRGLVVVGNL